IRGAGNSAPVLSAMAKYLLDFCVIKPLSLAPVGRGRAAAGGWSEVRRRFSAASLAPRRFWTGLPSSRPIPKQQPDELSAHWQWVCQEKCACHKLFLLIGLRTKIGGELRRSGRVDYIICLSNQHLLLVGPRSLHARGPRMPLFDAAEWSFSEKAVKL